jgi:drug/metabolite transporter (DMT)-like permease
MLLLTVTLFWSTTFSFAKEVLEFITPMEYVGIRFCLAALPLCILVVFKGFKLNSLVPGVVLGITFYMGMWLQSWGIQYTTASNAAFVTGLNVIIVCIAEAIIYHRKPSYLLSLSIIVAVAGLYFMSSVELLSIGKGDFLVLLSAFFWGAQVLLIDRFSKNYDNTSIVLLQILVAGIIGLFYAFLETRLVTLTANIYLVLPYLLYLAFVCSTLTLSLQIIGQRYTTPTLASLIFLLEPVFALIFSRIILQETLSSQQMIGAGLLLLSTVIATIDKIHR